MGVLPFTVADRLLHDPDAGVKDAAHRSRVGEWNVGMPLHAADPY